MARLASRLALGVAFAAALAAVSTAQGTPGATDWPSTNYDETANRYSPLDQITAQNVATLQQAWSFHLKPAGYTGRLREDEAIPLVIGNTMYLASPYGAIHALDATTGAEKWKFQLPEQRSAVEARPRLLAGRRWRRRRRSSSAGSRAGSTPSRRRTARSMPGSARTASSISRRPRSCRPA